MATITAIKVQKNNKTRVSLFLDDEFKTGLDASVAVRERLKVGDEISEDFLTQVLYESEVNGAFEKALKFLSYRMRSLAEIRRYLKEKDYDVCVTGKAIERLKQYNYIDDNAFAAALVKSYSARYGKFIVKSKLAEAGIPREIIEEVLDYEDDEGADQAAQKYLRTHVFDRQKLFVFLSNKGFSGQPITKAISRAARSSDEGGDLDFDGDGEE